MKVACLTATYGRYELVCESLACFLQQTATADATLLIYNQHPVPLVFDHPRVRIVNEDIGAASLGQIRRRMVDFADPSADYIHLWDDDDLFLPWHLEDCLDHIGSDIAWRPRRSWSSERNVSFSLLDSRYESSWLTRADFVRAAPMDTHPLYCDIPFFMQIEDRDALRTDDLGDLASYIHRWDTGTQHLSGYSFKNEAAQLANVAAWRAASNDVQNGGLLVPADLTRRWQQFLDGIKAQVSPDNFDEIQARLSLAAAVSRLDPA
jgi:hypothetical protein